MINLIKEYLLKLVDNIDAGNSNLTEDETIKLISVLKELTDRERRLSKYESCRYLNVSRATFDNYVRAGKLPRGEHIAGFKELSWSRKDLDEFIQKSKSNHSLRRKLESQLAQQARITACLMSIMEFIDMIENRREV